MIYRLLGITATLAVVVGLTLAPTFNLQLSATPAKQQYSVKPVDQNQVCPGALIRSGGQGGTSIGQLDRTGQASVSLSAAGEGSIELLGLDGGKKEEIASSANRTEQSLLSGKTLSLRAIERSLDQGQGSKVLISSQLQSVALDNLRGLAASSCPQPASEFWIVGGSTEAGREALLILANPSPIDATADLRIFTDLGELQVSGLSGISVLRESTTVISLASFAPTVGELAIEVYSKGAKLAGFIQQRAIRGTSAQGVDFIAAQLAPATDLVIPGLTVSGAKELERLQGLDEEYLDVGHVLRIFAPEGAVFTAQVISSDPEGFGAVLTDEVAPGTVADFPIEELLNGNYSVYVSSDKPIFASVRFGIAQREGLPKADFAWITPSDAIAEERVMTVGQEEAILTLANSSNQAIEVKVQSLSTQGSELITVSAQGSSSVLVTGTFSLSSSEVFFAQLTLLKENGVSDLQILEPRNIGSEVSVLFR